MLIGMAITSEGIISLYAIVSHKLKNNTDRAFLLKLDKHFFYDLK